MGVPIKLGAAGVEEIVELELNDNELTALRNSANAVQELVDVMASSK